MIKFVILLITLSLSTSTFAFNKRRCTTFLDRAPLFYGGGYFMTSTSQYFSSTGECAMLGKLDHDSKIFISHNFDQMKVDFARGQGEYAMAFASMYGCDHEAQKNFPRIIKNRFDELIRSESDEDLERVYNLLDREIRMNQALAPKCLIPKG